MSYILDALKKLEHDKARKERVQHGISSIAGELLRDDASTGSSQSPWRVSLLVLGVGLLAAIGTWLLLRGGAGVNIAGPSPIKPVQQPTSIVNVPSVPQPVVLATPVQSAAGAEPAAASDAAPKTSGEPWLASVNVGHNGRPKTVDRRGEQQRTAGSSAAEQPNTTSAARPPADLKVSGIAWQDERQARRAVVNGFLMHEGSAVSGCRIVEIHQDRVRFSQSGHAFDVPLVSATMSAGGK